MKTIQSKILFVVISTLVAITITVSFIAVSITHEIMHRDADRILNNVSQKEAAQINEMLNNFVKSAQIIKHYTANELTSPEALKDEKYLNEYLKQVRHLYDEIAINTSGAYSYYFCVSPDLTAVPSGFYSQFEEDGSIYKLSKKEFSKLTIITDRELKEYNNFTGDANNEWVEPHPSRFTDEPVISYVLPVYSQNTFIGLLGFNMKFDYLLDRVNGISVYEYGNALLLDENAEKYYNSLQHTESQDEYTVAVAELSNGMSLELRASYKDIQSNIRPLLSNIVYAFLAVLVLAVIFTFWVTRKIVGPLRKMIEAVSMVAVGGDTESIIIDSNDEIGVLSVVLNEAYEKIKEYSSYIKALAYKDSLTGVKNRTAYTEAIEEINKNINLGNPAFGVIVADLNYLKETNDTYGHDVGNELLIHAAKIFTDTFKTSSVYRIGGDEFVIILKGADFENYRMLLDKMNAAFSEDCIEVCNDRIPVSAAKGVAIFNPMMDNVFADVFDKADHAMYLNKMDMKAMSV